MPSLLLEDSLRFPLRSSLVRQKQLCWKQNSQTLAMAMKSAVGMKWTFTPLAVVAPLARAPRRW